MRFSHEDWCSFRGEGQNVDGTKFTFFLHLGNSRLFGIILAKSAVMLQWVNLVEQSVMGVS
jgi:hypothetical protein